MADQDRGHAGLAASAQASAAVCEPMVHGCAQATRGGIIMEFVGAAAAAPSSPDSVAAARTLCSSVVRVW
jgi:hypothetical protein